MWAGFWGDVCVGCGSGCVCVWAVVLGGWMCVWAVVLGGWMCVWAVVQGGWMAVVLGGWMCVWAVVLGGWMCVWAGWVDGCVCGLWFWVPGVVVGARTEDVSQGVPGQTPDHPLVGHLHTTHLLLHPEGQTTFLISYYPLLSQQC